jgi:hypothetical protein
MFIAPKMPTYCLLKQKETLYLKLIEQNNKDLANEGIDFPMSISQRIKNSTARKNL